MMLGVVGNEYMMLGIVGVIALVVGFGASWIGKAIGSKKKDDA